MSAAARPPPVDPPPRLYRQYFTRLECTQLDACPPDEALSELALLRILIARLLAGIRKKGRLPLTTRLSLLTSLCQTAITIAALTRIEFRRLGHTSPLDLALADLALLPFEQD